MITEYSYIIALNQVLVERLRIAGERQIQMGILLERTGKDQLRLIGQIEDLIKHIEELERRVVELEGR